MSHNGSEPTLIKGSHSLSGFCVNKWSVWRALDCNDFGASAVLLRMVSAREGDALSIRVAPGTIQ